MIKFSKFLFKSFLNPYNTIDLKQKIENDYNSFNARLFT